MNGIKKHTRQLIFLSQLFLFQEYGMKDVKMSSPALIDFFRRKSKPEMKFQNTQTFIPPSPSPLQVSPQPSKAFSVPAKAPLPATPAKTSTLKATETIETPKTNPIATNPQPQNRVPPPPPHHHANEIVLEPLNSSISPKNFHEFWKLFPNLFPDSILLETIPHDALALKIKNAWMQENLLTPIIILSFDDQEKNLAFLKNIARAISLCLAPVRVLSAPRLEKENRWNSILNASSVRLIIASDYGLYLQPELMKTYSESPQKRKYFLNHIPLLLLSDLSLYLKEPSLKSLLWRAICNEFTTSQPSSSS